MKAGQEWEYECDHCEFPITPELDEGVMSAAIDEDNTLYIKFEIADQQCPECQHNVDLVWRVEWDGTGIVPEEGSSPTVTYVNNDASLEIHSIAMSWLQLVEELWPDYWTATDTTMRCEFNDWMDSEHKDDRVSSWAVMNVTHEEIKDIIKQYYLRELRQSNPYQ